MLLEKYKVSKSHNLMDKLNLKNYDMFKQSIYEDLNTFRNVLPMGVPLKEEIE
jgi:hypothetical protein